MTVVRPIALLAILVFSACGGRSGAEWDHRDLSFGPEERQWLNILEGEGGSAAPIYLFAHANGGTADDLSERSAELITSAGYAVVSWESIRTIATISDTETAAADLELALAWVEDNADTYNLDASRIIVGGRSRGSVVSWQQGHGGDPAIVGLYFYNALPDGAWEFEDEWNPLDDVTENSPPMYLAFGPGPNVRDIHDPINLYPVVDRYEALGLEDDVTLTEGMDADRLDPFHYFPEFAASLE